MAYIVCFTSHFTKMYQPKTFSEASRPVLLIGRFLGLTDCLYLNGKFTRTQLSKTLALLLKIVYLTASVFFWYSTYTGPQAWYPNNIYNSILALQNLIFSITVPVTYWSFHKDHFYRTIDLIDCVDKVDAVLKVNVDNLASLRRFLAVYAGLMVSVTSIIVSYACLVSNTTYIFLNLTLQSQIFVYVEASVLFYKFELNRRFGNLNRELWRIKNGDKIWSQMWVCCKNFDSFLGLTTLVLVCWCYVKFVNIFYYLFAVYDGVEVVIYLFLGYAIVEVLLVFGTAEVVTESAKTALLYEEALKRHDTKLSRRGMFYLQVQFERSAFSVCGLFTINWNFLLGMFGSIVSNLIILLQFNELAKSSTSPTK